METKTFKKGEVIFKQGDLSDCMYDILWGEVGIYADYGTPEEKLLTTLETERFFGEMGMIEGRRGAGEGHPPQGHHAGEL